MSKSQSFQPRITVALGDLQDQVRMVDRLARAAEEPESGQWTALASLLSDLYIQLQHQKRVSIHRSARQAPSKATK